MEEIREIIQLIDDSSIYEFSYENNGTKIELKKKQDKQNVSLQPINQAPIESEEQGNIAPETVQVQNDGEKSEPSDDTDASYDYEITSPMVGTFYRASSPDSDPYVEVGSTVNESTVVCIVEAMKLFNEIEAEVNGTITEILVEDSELVEYGQPLFRVKKK